MRKLNPKEIESILYLSPEKRYQYFLKRSIGFDEVWTAVDKHGHWLETELEDHKLLFLWSAEEYAVRECNKYPIEYSPQKYNIKTFLT
ncbi:MAG: DUF2750 domain-containing protein [Saprospiraceae bacterium]|nr:DUF2750 domain-containing protein [Saprospiraceae bacterium]